VNDLADAFALADELGLKPLVPGAAGHLVANPIGLSQTPPTYHRAPPRLGEHTEDLAAWLDNPLSTGDNA
jgi:crotonobetainyl-CoA:carnitine CoA-transferase CaiB-like acyl-CoA transferase